MFRSQKNNNKKKTNNQLLNFILKLYFVDLDLSLSNGIVLSKFYKVGLFELWIVNFASLTRFPLNLCYNVGEFNNRNTYWAAKLL